MRADLVERTPAVRSRVLSHAPRVRAWGIKSDARACCAGAILFLCPSRGDDNADGGQYPTAIGLGEVAEEISAQQVFALGDNFYHNAKTSHCTNSGICPDNKDGVDGVLRFKTTFEDVYTADSLKKIPFYAIAGNVRTALHRRIVCSNF